MKRLWYVLLLLILVSCDALPGWLSAPPATQVGTATVAVLNTAAPAQPTLTPAGHPTAGQQTQTPGEAGLPVAPSAPGTLVLWVPPEFNPAHDTLAGAVLRARLELFEQENGVQVIVRVKDLTGPGSLVETLSAASAAAPLAMPSVVALPRSDLEEAALKSLIQPLDGLSTAIDQSDWYTYARDLAMVQGTPFALPFAGDALIVAYRPTNVVTAPVNWASAYQLAQPLAFPAGEVLAETTLAMYLSMGGQVADAQRRPILQPEVLSQVLQVLADGEERGIFPYWLSQYETFPQVWQAYLEGRVNAAIVWSSYYLNDLPIDTAATPLPPLVNGTDASQSVQTLATGWGWAVAEPVPERRLMAARLAEFLAEGDFLAEWTEAAGYLPTRPSALAAWRNGALKTLLSPIAISCQARPSDDLLSAQGPVLKEATLRILKRETDAAQAAQEAAERLSVPQK